MPQFLGNSADATYHVCLGSSQNARRTTPVFWKTCSTRPKESWTSLAHATWPHDPARARRDAHTTTLNIRRRYHRHQRRLRSALFRVPRFRMGTDRSHLDPPNRAGDFRYPQSQRVTISAASPSKHFGTIRQSNHAVFGRINSHESPEYGTNPEMMAGTANSATSPNKRTPPMSQPKH
jgi:hypothetical protein